MGPIKPHSTAQVKLKTSLFLVQHYSTPQCENPQWLHHCGPPSDASRAAPADGGPDNRAASQSALISSAGCQLGPAGFGPQRAHAVLHLSLAAVTRAALLLTARRSPWTPVCPDQNSEKHLIHGRRQHAQRRKGGQNSGAGHVCGRCPGLQQSVRRTHVSRRVGRDLDQAASGVCWTRKTPHDSNMVE